MRSSEDERTNVPQLVRIPFFVYDWRSASCGLKQWRWSRVGSLPSTSQLVRSGFEHLEGHNSLEDWLAEKRQHEEFSNRDGTLRRVQDDSLMAAMCKLMPTILEETVRLKPVEHSFGALFDRLDDKPVRVKAKRDRDTHVEEVDALNKGGKKKRMLELQQVWTQMS